MKTKTLTLSSLFLALALVLPFLTMQVPLLGQMLTPIHFPVIIAAYFLGPLYAGIVGFIAPLLRMIIFGMPGYPMSLIMAFELATYAVVTGLSYKFLINRNLNKVISIYISLFVGAVIGRVVYTFVLLLFLDSVTFIPVFLTSITGSFPGIILQFLLIPVIVLRFKENHKQ